MRDAASNKHKVYPALRWSWAECRHGRLPRRTYQAFQSLSAEELAGLDEIKEAYQQFPEKPRAAKREVNPIIHLDGAANDGEEVDIRDMHRCRDLWGVEIDGMSRHKRPDWQGVPVDAPVAYRVTSEVLPEIQLQFEVIVDSIKSKPINRRTADQRLGIHTFSASGPKTVAWLAEHLGISIGAVRTRLRPYNAEFKKQLGLTLEQAADGFARLRKALKQRNSKKNQS